MREPLVDLNVSHEDRIRLLSCVCTGHIFRKILNSSKNISVSFNLFSYPVKYSVDRFFIWRRNSKNPFLWLFWVYLRFRFRDLLVDLKYWAEDTIGEEIRGLPKFIESFEDAAEVAAVYSSALPAVLPECRVVAGVRDQCLRRGFRYKKVFNQEQGCDNRDELALVDTAESDNMHNFDSKTGAHFVKVTPDIVSQMHCLFQKIQSK